jgi:hypothetical protein
VASGGSSAHDDFLRVDAELRGFGFQPTDGAFRIGDAHAFAGLAGFVEVGRALRMHAVFRRDRDESAFGEVPAGGAELGEIAALPAAAMEEDDRGNLGLCRVVVRREVDLQSPWLIAGHFVSERLPGCGGLFRLVIGRVGCDSMSGGQQRKEGNPCYGDEDCH